MIHLTHPPPYPFNMPPGFPQPTQATTTSNEVYTQTTSYLTNYQTTQDLPSPNTQARLSPKINYKTHPLTNQRISRGSEWVRSLMVFVNPNQPTAWHNSAMTVLHLPQRPPPTYNQWHPASNETKEKSTANSVSPGTEIQGKY